MAWETDTKAIRTVWMEGMYYSNFVTSYMCSNFGKGIQLPME